MERLTARSENGTGIYAEPSSETQKWNNNRFYVLQKLADYEDTGFTPEQIKDQQHNLGVAYNVIAELEKDLNNWKYEALTYANQLGMLQIWLESRMGITLEYVLEDCKTMLPDTKYTGSDNS